MSSSSSEVLASFQSITGVQDDALAIAFLEETNWNLEAGIERYFSVVQGEEVIPPPSSTGTGTGTGTDIDTAAYMNQGVDEDEVREPMASTVDVLSEDPRGEEYMHFGGKGKRRGFHPKTSTTVFDVLRDFKEEEKYLAENQSKSPSERQKIQKLADLFRPPIELLCQEPFDMAKVLAVNQKKWLLVNIQDSSEFSSHRLNRDTWSDSNLKKLIQQFFIFWQRYSDNADGQRYATYYPVAQTRPHVAIIDPRTGQLIKHWTGFVEPSELLQDLLSFVESNSIDDFSAPPKVPSVTKPVVEQSTQSNQSETKPPKSLIDLSEDEQLAAVIAESLAQQQQDKQKKPSETNDDIGSKKRKEAEDHDHGAVSTDLKKLKVQNATSNNTLTSAALTSAQSIPVPSADLDCVLQIRESNGNVLKKEFNSLSPLKVVYDWVKQNSADGAKPFSLMTPFPRKVYTDDMLNKTLKECDFVPRATLVITLNKE